MNAAFLFILHLMVFLSGGRTPGLQQLAPLVSSTHSTGASYSSPKQTGVIADFATASALDRSAPDGSSFSDDLPMIDTEDEDEGDHVPLVLLSCCLVALVSTGLLPVHIRPLLRRTSLFYKHFSFLGTDRYLAFCVFRI